MQAFMNKTTLDLGHSPFTYGPYTTSKFLRLNLCLIMRPSNRERRSKEYLNTHNFCLKAKFLEILAKSAIQQKVYVM